MVILVFLYVHITGCIFFYIINANSKYSWLPPFDYIDGSKSVFWYQAPDVKQSWTYQYGCCLYYMMLAVGGNELGPGDLAELIYVILANIFGLIFKVYLFGELSGLVMMLGQTAAKQ